MVVRWRPAADDVRSARYSRGRESGGERFAWQQTHQQTANKHGPTKNSKNVFARQKRRVKKEARGAHSAARRPSSVLFLSPPPSSVVAQSVQSVVHKSLTVSSTDPRRKKYLPGDGALARDRASLALLPGPRPAKGEAGACDPTTYRRYLPAAVVYGFCFALARRDTLDFSLVHYFVLRVRLSSPARAQNFVELVPTMCSTGVRLYETVSVRRRWVPSPLTRGQQGCV